MFVFLKKNHYFFIYLFINGYNCLVTIIFYLFLGRIYCPFHLVLTLPPNTCIHSYRSRISVQVIRFQQPCSVSRLFWDPIFNVLLQQVFKTYSHPHPLIKLHGYQRLISYRQNLFVLHQFYYIFPLRNVQTVCLRKFKTLQHRYRSATYIVHLLGIIFIFFPALIKLFSVFMQLCNVFDSLTGLLTFIPLAVTLV